MKNRGFRAEPVPGVPPVVGEAPVERRTTITRYMVMFFYDKTALAAPLNRWLDATTTTILFNGILPSDYAPGTDIVVNALIRPRATGNVRWNFSEFIHANAGGDTFGTRAPETNALVTSPVVIDTMKVLGRTINGVTFSLVGGDILWYQIARIGADAADTAANSMDGFGAWVTYTAFF